MSYFHLLEVNKTTLFFIARNCTTGMLGNFNGIKEDDLNTKDGNPTTGDMNKRALEMGNSYANVKTILAGK